MRRMGCVHASSSVFSLEVNHHSKKEDPQEWLLQDSLEFSYSRINRTKPKSGCMAAVCITTSSPSTKFQAGHKVCTKAAQTSDPSGERNLGDLYRS